MNSGLHKKNTIVMRIMLICVLCVGAVNCGSSFNPHTGNIRSNDKELKSYSLQTSVLSTGTINSYSRKITVIVPYATDITSIIAVFAFSGNKVKVGDNEQISGSTSNDFTHPVKYMIVAEDGTTADYTVIVYVAANSAKLMTSFSVNTINGQTNGEISEKWKTVNISVPYGTDPSSLVPTFTTSGSSVTVDGVTQISGETSNDFTYPLTYTVTALDGTVSLYTVTITVESKTAKSITSYSIMTAGGIEEGVINDHAISVSVPYGTVVTSLISTFSTSGAFVQIGNTTQKSGITANDFTSPVAYKVTAADGSTVVYTVTVTVRLNSAKSISAYSINGYTGVIDDSAGTITVQISYDMDITDLVAKFTAVGRVSQSTTGEQVSEVTSNDFSNTITYTVTADDSSTRNYTVTAILVGKVITIAGSPGVMGSNDGVGSSGHFNSPTGIAVSNDGSLFVTDSGNNTIRKLTRNTDATWTVTTIAGTVGTLSLFNNPTGIAVNNSNSLVVIADTGNARIRYVKYSALDNTWDVLTSSTDFSFPTGVFCTNSGNCYIADPIKWWIYSGSDPFTKLSIHDGAEFVSPIAAIYHAKSQKIFIADGNTCKRLDWRVSDYTRRIVAGDPTEVSGNEAGFQDDTNADGSSRFNKIHSMAEGVNGLIYVSDMNNNVIRYMKYDSVKEKMRVITIAGSPTVCGYNDGLGSAALFSNPAGIAVDGQGIYVVDSGNNTIRMITKP